MKTLFHTLVASLCLTAVVYAAEPQFNAIEAWLQPPSQMETIGPAHGDVAVSSTGDVYVSILGGPRGGIQVYGPDGKYLRNVPNAPTDFHGFVIHKGTDGEFIYGARLGGQSILKMQLDGTVVLTIDGAIIPESFVNKQKDKPVLRLTAVDVAPDGRIFAVDGYSSDYIHVFDPQGKYLKSFGGKAAPYGFKTNHKIAIDTRFDPPRILCCDRENRRVVNLSIDGEVLSVVPDMKRPAAIAVFGDLAAVAEIEGRVSLIDKDGKVVKSFGANPVKEQTATNQVKPADWHTGIFTAPHGIDFDGSGNLYVTEFNQFGRVLRFDRDGKPDGKLGAK
jgi:DNA-binding beta-propeller fold protein YncE